MAEYATKDEVQEMIDKASGRIVADISEVIANFAQQVDGRFNAVESRLESLETKFSDKTGIPLENL